MRWTPCEVCTQPLKDAGFSKKQIWAASKKLGVKRQKAGMTGGWEWRLRDPGEVAFAMVRAEDSLEDSEGSNVLNGESSESSGDMESSVMADSEVL